MKRYTITIYSTFIKWIALIFTLIWIMYDFYILCFKKATFSKVFKNLNGTLLFILIAVIGIYTIQLLLRYYDGVIIKEYYPNDNIQSNEKLVVYTFGEKMKSGPTYLIYEKTFFVNFKCNILISYSFEYKYDYDLVQEYSKILNSNDESFCHKKIENHEYIFN